MRYLNIIFKMIFALAAAIFIIQIFFLGQPGFSQNPDSTFIQSGDKNQTLIRDTAAAPLFAQSRPACNSADGCKTDTAAAPLFAQSRPACNSADGCKTDTAAAPLFAQSRPACNSADGCKTDTAAAPLFAQVGSDPICSSAGCDYKKKKDEYPMDYVVPNFGMDKDIVDSQAHEEAAIRRIKGGKSLSQRMSIDDPNWNSAEGYKMRHFWPSDPAKETEYKLTGAADLDEDIKDTHAHLADAEEKHGTWDIENTQNLAEATLHPTRKSEFKNWPDHRIHFENNYENFPAKRAEREDLRIKMMHNWGTNTY